MAGLKGVTGPMSTTILIGDRKPFPPAPRVEIVSKEYVWEVHLNGASVVYSWHQGSAEFAAERLRAGGPIQTPNEFRTSAVNAYASIFPSRLRFYDHTYLVLGSGNDWVQGGIISRDVTPITDEGRQYMRQSGLGCSAHDVQAQRIWRQYHDKTWPYFHRERSQNRLYPLQDNSTSRFSEMHALPSVDPLWLQDAQEAMKLFLMFGVDQEHTMDHLRSWAHNLTKKFGEGWFR